MSYLLSFSLYRRFIIQSQVCGIVHAKMWHVGTMPVVDECHDLVVNAILWTALAFIAVGLRLFTRGFIVKRTGWDDYLMAAAMVSYPLISLFYHSTSPLAVSISYMPEVSMVTMTPRTAFSCQRIPGLHADRVTRFAQ